MSSKKELFTKKTWRMYKVLQVFADKNFPLKKDQIEIISGKWKSSFLKNDFVSIDASFLVIYQCCQRQSLMKKQVFLQIIQPFVDLFFYIGFKEQHERLSLQCLEIKILLSWFSVI